MADRDPLAEAATRETRENGGPSTGDVGVLAPALTAPALTAAGMGAYGLDLAAGRLELDARTMQILGRDATDAVLPTTAVDACIHPKDRTHLYRLMRAAIAEGTGYETEFRVELPDGQTRWVATRGSVLGEADGSASRLLGVAFDTTNNDTRRVARFLEAIPTAFFSLDRSWQFSYVNAGAERVLGRSREEMVGGNIWELFPAAVGSDFETHYRHVMTTGEPTAFDAYYPAPLETWYEVRAWPAPDGVSVYFLDVTGRRELQEQTERAGRRAELTATATAKLSGSLDAEEAVAGLAQILVPELADWCIITLADMDELGGLQGLRDIGWWHVDPGSRSVVETYARHRIEALRDQSFLLRALSSHDVVTVTEDATAAIQGVLAPGRSRDLIAELAPTSVTVLPLRGRERVLGAISLFNGSGRPPIPPEDLATAQEVADRAGLGLDNAYLYTRQRQVAEELQRSFLTDPPGIGHLEIAVKYIPAAHAAKVGGDWYDAFEHPDGSTALIIGDVAGHDIHAAASMGQIRSLLRGIAVATRTGPAGLLSEVDGAMHTLRQETVASAVVMCIAPPSSTAPEAVGLRWSSAGHPPPMVIEADGTVTALAGRGLLLGVRPESAREELETTLTAGATLLLYTDGLVERRDAGGLRAGLARLQETLAELGHLSLDEMCEQLLSRLLPDDPEDDVALLAVRLRHPDAPRA